MASSRSALRKVSLRNIAAHKVRLLLTVLSVVLGTAFISGAFVFTASLNKAFDGALATAYDGIDIAISTKSDKPLALDNDTVDKLGHYPGVRAANVSMQSNGIVLTGSNGKAIQTTGAPAMGLIYYAPDRLVGQPMKFSAGAAPSTPDEVAINSTTARLGDLKVGDNTTVVTANSRANVKVVGIVESEADSTGWLSVFFEESAWRKLYTDGQHIERVSIAADPGTNVEQLSESLSSDFPELKVEQGKALAEEDSKKVSEALGFVNYFLVAFGLIGLLVGTFIISNTFSMLVAQRTNEFAVLRAIGASRNQLTRTVLFEALVVGLVGSAIGVLTGFGLTKLLYVALDSFGITMPGDGLTVTSSAIIIPIVAGLLITLLAAWAPALRAGAIPPVEAMRSGDKSSSNKLIARTVTGIVAGGISAALLIWPAMWEDAETSTRATLVGVGALGAIVALWLSGPALARPLVGGLGRVFGAPFGAVGKLASTNSQRNPRRTAATAFALMLGLALVASVGMLGASMKAAVDEWLDNNLTADYILAPPMTAHVALPADVEDTVAKTDGVSDTATLSLAPLSVVSKEDAAALAKSGGEGNSSAFGPPEGNATFFNGDVQKWYNTRTVSGSLDLSAEDAGVVVQQSTATKNRWRPGTELMLAGPQGAYPIKVTGVFEDTSDQDQVFMVSPHALEQAGGALSMLIPLQVYVDVAATDAKDVENMRASLEDAVADYLVVQVMNVEEYGSIAATSINTMLGIVYALLALAVIISILGIINTLALSIVERKQEIGMLRAIGVQRFEIRRMIRLESLQIAVFGAITGVLLGLALGWSLLTVLGEEGIGTIVVPWLQIGGMLIGSAVVGIIAALWPAAKAAKTPPLAAIADE